MNLTAQQTTLRPPSRTRIAVTALFVAFPAILFYIILFRTAQDIPLYDDYGGLDFINKLTQLNGFTAKLSFLLSTQFNEYKLVFAEALTWLQYDLWGRVDFEVMSAISNAFVLLLALLLWKMFLPTHKDLGSRLALFIPVSWLLFQLQYYEILNWGGAGLQHIPSTVFAFAAIYLLFQKTRKTFCGAVACYVLAVASSGNGFLLLPIGLLVLASDRHYARIVAWLIASAGCIAAYSYHFSVMSSKASPDHSILSALTRLRPAFVIGFIGSAASIPFQSASFVLGAALCIFFGWMARRGYVRRNPAVSCCLLFLLLTAIGVAGIRSDLGLADSTPSRYTIFSDLFLIFAWFAIVEEFLQHTRVPLLHNRAYLGAVAAAVCFSLFMDAVAIVVIDNWDDQLIQGMTNFEHPNPPDSTEGPDMPSWKGHPKLEAFNPKARAVLFESIRLGVYRPPKL
jgi:hypothetical protein